MGLGEEKRRIKGFSRGMKQRLGIAQALLNRPKLLICDEPTSALDPIGRKEILDILLAARDQTTILFSTHILSDVERICSDIAVLNDGKIVVQGALSEIREMRTSEEFVVEVEKSEDVAKILNTFSNCKATASTQIVFQNDEKNIFDIMKYLAENKTKVLRIERMEPSLESLFLEVVEK